MQIRTIRSGGQTGVDRAALDAARMAGVPLRGWCPRGGLAEDLPEPPGLLTAYPELTETPARDYIQRTEWNVRDSDATLIICRGGIASSPGTLATVQFALEYGRPHIVVDAADAPSVRAWLAPLAEHEGLELNVAGPRESGCPGIYELAKALILQLLTA